jgi:formylglycine-generating enzyme required for sulfatase activity
MRCFHAAFLAGVLGGCAGQPNDDTGPATSKKTPSVTPGTLVEIPAGSFDMGCDAAVHPECTGDEAPVHRLQLSAFWIEATEVTAAQWRACEAAHACPALAGAAAGDDVAVGFVPHADADAYCHWLGRRLPTEAEWERAARGPNGGLYPWGDDAPDCERAASRACDGGITVVATHPDGRSPEGVYDMAGNAWEWVSDGYNAEYYTTSPAEDPEMDDATAGLRSVRGVDGWSDLSVLRSTNREMAIPDAVSPLVGFRCVSEEAP